MTLLSAPYTLSPSLEKDAATGSVSYGPIKDLTQPEQNQTQSSRRMKFAVDFAYTLNHSIVCTLTDPFTDVPIGVFVQNMMASIRKNNKDQKVTFSEFRDKMKPKNMWDEFKSGMSFKKEEDERFSPATTWFVSEVGGDFGAVPVVVGLQHFAPKLMEGIGKLARPIAKPLFQRSALRTLRAELKLAGLDIEKSPEFEHRTRAIFQGTTNELPESLARIKKVYEREMEDLPNAIMWTVASPAINILMQKTVMGNKTPIRDLLLAKGLGATVTSSLTVGMRAKFPTSAQKWDDFSTEKFGKPVTSAVAKLLGLDAEEVQAGVQKKTEQHNKGGTKWTERTTEPSQPRFAKVSTQELTQRANKEAMEQLQRTAVGEHSSKLLQRDESIPSPSPAGSR